MSRNNNFKKQNQKSQTSKQKNRRKGEKGKKNHKQKSTWFQTLQMVQKTLMIVAKISCKPASISTSKTRTNEDNRFWSPFFPLKPSLLGTPSSIHGTLTQEFLLWIQSLFMLFTALWISQLNLLISPTKMFKMEWDF